MRTVYQVHDPKYGVTALFDTIDDAQRALNANSHKVCRNLLPSGLCGHVEENVVYESFEEYLEDLK